MNWTIVNDSAGVVDGIPRGPGLYDIETTRADGGRARFSLCVPAAPARPLPLVLVLHYAGQPTRFYGRPLLSGLIEPALRPLGALLVAPESRGGQWHDESNEAWVIDLLRTLIDAYEVDCARIVVTGYSMGAIGTWHFITHYPELFAAGIPIAGFPNRDLSCAVPVHAFHAASDELFPLARLEQGVAEARSRGCPLELTRAEVQGHYDVNGYLPALGAAVPWLERQWAH